MTWALFACFVMGYMIGRWEGHGRGFRLGFRIGAAQLESR